MESTAYFENIKTAIDSGKIVSFRWLSDTLSLSSNEAKKLLFEYAEKYKANVKTIFCVIGTLTDSSRSAVLTSTEKLDSTKASLMTVTSVHVYSLQKSIPKDYNIICATECQLKTAGYQSTCQNPQLVLEKAKQSPIRLDVEIKEPLKREAIKPVQVKTEPKKIEKKTVKPAKKSAAKPKVTKTASKGPSLLQKLANQPKAQNNKKPEIVKNSVLGKRPTESRPSPVKKETIVKPEKKKQKVPDIFGPSVGLTKYEIDSSSQKKRRLTRAAGNTDTKKDSDSILWDSDEEMKSPDSQDVEILFSSDSEEEIESQDEIVSVPTISPKKPSPFDKFKTNGDSPGSKTRTTTTKLEKTDSGYLVFTDEVVESDAPSKTNQEAKTKRKSLIKKTTGSEKPTKGKKSTDKKPEAKPNQKSLLSFFGGK